MNAETFSQNADLIARYHKYTGAAFEKSRNMVCQTLGAGMGVDVSDAFSRAHVAVARVVQEIERDMETPEGSSVDVIQTALTMVVLSAVFMSNQETLDQYRKQLEPHLKGAPDSIIIKGVLLAATPTIKSRQHDLTALVSAMAGMFMGNVVSQALGR